MGEEGHRLRCDVQNAECRSASASVVALDVGANHSGQGGSTFEGDRGWNLRRLKSEQSGDLGGKNQGWPERRNGVVREDEFEGRRRQPDIECHRLVDARLHRIVDRAIGQCAQPKQPDAKMIMPYYNTAM